MFPNKTWQPPSYTILSNVDFKDRDFREHISNTIDEKLLARTNIDGHTTMPLEETIRLLLFTQHRSVVFT